MNESPTAEATSGDAYKRGFEKGKFDCGQRYDGGMGSGYESKTDRAQFRAGYGAGWDKFKTSPMGPTASNVHDLEQRAKKMEHLCKQMIATLMVNRNRGLITTADDRMFDDLIAKWSSELESA